MGALGKLASEYIPKWFTPSKVDINIKPETSAKTQITTTTSTYEKAAKILGEGKTLDYGSGRGIGANVLDADTFEPFARKGYNPTFTDSNQIPSNSYDNITSLNVLNVVKPDTRDAIVADIGRILKTDGTAIITTRGMDIFGNKGNMVKGALGNEPRSIITSAGTYQKGFTQSELKEYVSEILGSDFSVFTLKGLEKAGVKIKKLGDK